MSKDDLSLPSTFVNGIQQKNVNNQSVLDKGIATRRPKFEAVVPGMLQEIESTLSKQDFLFDNGLLGLPRELLVRILRWVGYFHAVSLEECARTCKRMYIASRSPFVWRKMYQSTRCSQKCCTITPTARVHDYRQLYFSEPRLRTDGLYICKLTYLRPGMTVGTFYQPVHMVTYYRYLRFFGAEYGFRCWVMVTTDEPKKVIEQLRQPPDDIMRYIPFGISAHSLLMNAAIKCSNQSSMRNTTVFMGKYIRPSDASPSYSLELVAPHASTDSVFEMELTISKYNKVIVCDRYSSLETDSHETCRVSRYDFDVHDWGKFIFSRVRSYIS